MNFINQKVTHKKFGTGKIIDMTEQSMEVSFKEASRKFVFPDAFEQHLVIEDTNLNGALQQLIEEKQKLKLILEQEHQQKIADQREKMYLQAQSENIMKYYKLHPESQMAFACEDNGEEAIQSWNVNVGLVKTGANKGKPNKPSRLHQNSAVILTTLAPGAEEKTRKIVGVYMVKENFVGKLSESGNVPAHAKYKMQLTDKEQLDFWSYYSNKKSPESITTSKTQVRYFDNMWMAQILQDIVELKETVEEKQLAYDFFVHFCKANKIASTKIPAANGPLLVLA
jgi:hypothetical protein